MAFAGNGDRSPEQQRIKDLEDEVRKLKIEKDVPKKVQDSFGSRYGRKGLKHIYRIKTPNQVIFEMLWSNGIYDVKLLYSETGTIVGKLIC